MKHFKTSLACPREISSFQRRFGDDDYDYALIMRFTAAIIALRYDKAIIACCFFASLPTDEMRFDICHADDVSDGHATAGRLIVISDAARMPRTPSSAVSSPRRESLPVNADEDVISLPMSILVIAQSRKQTFNATSRYFLGLFIES